MGMMQRTKGKVGERDAANLLSDLTGYQITRRVRQHDGDSDLVGLPGWSLEVKRVKKADRADIRGWWDQAVAQAEREGCIPVLLYRRDRDEWRAVWPLSAHLGVQHSAMWTHVMWTVEGTLEAFAAAVREIGAQKQSEASRLPTQQIDWSPLSGAVLVTI